MATYSTFQALIISSNHFSGTIPVGIIGLGVHDIDISNNNLVFNSGMQDIAGGFISIYTPQANIRLITIGNTLTAPAGSLAGNVYTWYRNDTLIATTTGDSTFQGTTSGNYHVAVTNPTCPDLTLYSDTIAVTALAHKSHHPKCKGNQWAGTVAMADNGRGKYRPLYCATQ